MITKEDIEKAAQNYEDSLTYSKASEQYDVQKAFKAGANWRINTVWHDVSEEPNSDKGDLLVIVKDGFGKNICVRQNAYYVLKYGCVRWAYMEDLLPNKED